MLAPEDYIARRRDLGVKPILSTKPTSKLTTVSTHSRKQKRGKRPQNATIDVMSRVTTTRPRAATVPAINASTVAPLLVKHKGVNPKKTKPKNRKVGPNPESVSGSPPNDTSALKKDTVQNIPNVSDKLHSADETSENHPGGSNKDIKGSKIAKENADPSAKGGPAIQNSPETQSNLKAKFSKKVPGPSAGNDTVAPRTKGRKKRNLLNLGS